MPRKRLFRLIATPALALAMTLAMTMAMTLATALFSAAPATAQQGQEQIVRMILNITKGSMATPGGVGYLAIAEERLKEIKTASGDSIQVADALEPTGESSRMGLIRAVASISASVAIARDNPAASVNVRRQGQNVIDTADRVLETAQTLHSLSVSGTEAEKRSSLINALEAELGTLATEVHRLASGEGLMTR